MGTKMIKEKESEAGPPSQDFTARGPTRRDGENKKILVMSREPRFSEGVVDYAVNLADRLEYDLIALNVGPDAAPAGIFHYPLERYRRWQFRQQARATAAALAARARRHGVGFEHVVQFGEVRQVLDRLNNTKRRIEFVINASALTEADLTGGVTLPVFTVTGDQGEMTMARETGEKKVKQAAKTAVFGVATAALYAAVFFDSSRITGIFAQGGWYAALPIATAFLFSFVHGTFSHHVWELLGIHAPKKTVQPRPTAARRTVRRQRPRPRLRLNV